MRFFRKTKRPNGRTHIYLLGIKIASYKRHIKRASSKYWCTVMDETQEDVSEQYASKIKAFVVPKVPYAGHIYFDIEKALYANPSFKKLGLVFYMGIGDYFYATNFIEMLKRKFPTYELVAFVSRNFDSNNSPLVGKCLETNPNISQIIYYDGYRDKHFWKNYDYSDCYKIKDDDTLILPMVYRYDPYVLSRTETLCETYNMDVPVINPLPIIYDYAPSEMVIDVFNSIKERLHRVVFIQMTARSTSFHYPHIDKIIQGLLKRKYFVISAENTSITDNNLYVIDINKFSINDSVALLRLIKNNQIPLYFLTTISCFFSVSAAWQIPNLCMQHFYDHCISSVYYSNAFLIVNKKYLNIPSDRQYICPINKQFRQHGTGNIIFDPDFVLQSFDNMIDRNCQK